jgi:hypothetical protein
MRYRNLTEMGEQKRGRSKKIGGFPFVLPLTEVAKRRFVSSASPLRTERDVGLVRFDALRSTSRTFEGDSSGFDGSETWIEQGSKCGRLRCVLRPFEYSYTFS